MHRRQVEAPHRKTADAVPRTFIPTSSKALGLRALFAAPVVIHLVTLAVRLAVSAAGLQAPSCERQARPAAIGARPLTDSSPSETAERT